MAQMVAIYKTPKNPAEFEKYVEVRVPLAKRLPGLRKYETKGPIVSLAGA